MSSGSSNRLTSEILKGREEKEINTYPDNLSLRVHRANSWIQRAEMADDDHDIAFACYWIAFNPAYAEDPEAPTEDSDSHAEDQAATTDSPERERERVLFRNYFRRILDLDTDRAIYEAIWNRFSGPIRILLENKYVFQPFWKHVNGVPGYQDWESRFDLDRDRISRALAGQDTLRILTLLFDRLYVLRNQILHGGATWNSSVNRSQVRDGATIMGFLVPLFVNTMMDNPSRPWGANYYPVMNL